MEPQNAGRCCNRSTLLISIILVACVGCRGPRTAAWQPVWEVPPKALDYAERGGELERPAGPWRFAGTIPRAFKNADGHYRICWIKKDPLRDSYWYMWYEFSADGSPRRAGHSSIPSPLKVPDPAKIPGW